MKKRIDIKKIVLILAILLVLVLVIILFTNHSNKETLTSVKDEKVASETETSNSVVESIKTGKGTIQYEFKTDRDAIINVNYDDSKFNFENDRLSNEYYSIYITINSYKSPMFETESELLSNNSNYSNIEIDGIKAVTASSSEYATILVKLDDYNILNIIAETKGLKDGDSIIIDSDYKELINSIKISIK